MTAGADALDVDVLVVGAGPAGQKAAVQAAKAGREVVLVERERGIGGECVRRGTIPSKTLRETALYLSGLARRSGGVLDVPLAPSVQIESLMQRLGSVLRAHEGFLAAQMERNGVRVVRGRARFVSPEVVELREPDGRTRRLRGRVVVLAPGSRPRHVPEVPVDHEHVHDSDSILSLPYLPRSLAILGGGVVASEFASIFAALGVLVTIVDPRGRALAFLDEEVVARFVAAFETAGGRTAGGSRIESVASDGRGAVVTRLADGRTIESEKVLCALGRVAEVEGLGLEAAGLALDARGHLPVDEHCRTKLAHVYAVGDVIGPPALAASAMEQGRRAVRHALDLPVGEPLAALPVGVYTIPEISQVGLTEAEAAERLGGAHVGRADFSEIARGHVSGATDGLLKLVVAPDGRVVGAQIVGEGACELVHVAQMAIVGRLGVEAFVENVFNFPTLAEAYRVAALAALAARDRARRAA